MTALTQPRIDYLASIDADQAQRTIWSLAQEQTIDDTSNNGTRDHFRQQEAGLRARTRAEEALILHDRFPGAQYDPRWFRSEPTLAEALTPRKD